MARPRVFISSTYYDLKHLRSSIENFIESLGYDATLSEKGNIAYTSDLPLDESCYKEVENASIFVLILGGRYGSESSKEKNKLSKEFFDRYESITKKEFKRAIKRSIPVYTLIETNVYSEYQTFLKNKDSKDIQYAHVDSVNTFLLIEDILGMRLNNPFKSFEKYSEIESWLKEQWAGFFQELLSRLVNQQQLSDINIQISELKEINTTLKNYLESVLGKISPEESNIIIEKEHKRLVDSQLLNELSRNPMIEYMLEQIAIPVEESIQAIKKASTVNEVRNILSKKSKLQKESLYDMIQWNHPNIKLELNEAREILNLSPF